MFGYMKRGINIKMKECASGVEDVCEIAAYSNDFLNQVTKKYIEKDRF